MWYLILKDGYYRKKIINLTLIIYWYKKKNLSELLTFVYRVITCLLCFNFF